MIVTLSALLTLCGLLSPGVIARADVDPRPGAFNSEYLEARGYPFDWYLAEAPDGMTLTLSERVLTGWLLTDFLLILIAVYGVVTAIRVFEKGIRSLRVKAATPEKPRPAPE